CLLPRLQLCTRHNEPRAGGWPPGGRAGAGQLAPTALCAALALASPAHYGGRRGDLRGELRAGLCSAQAVIGDATECVCGYARTRTASSQLAVLVLMSGASRGNSRNPAL